MAVESQPFWIAVYDNDGKVAMFRRVEAPSGRAAIQQLSEQLSVGNDNYGAVAGTTPIWFPTDVICGARTWPYTEHNVCVRKPHQTGRHKDDKDRLFDSTGYSSGEVKP